MATPNYVIDLSEFHVDPTADSDDEPDELLDMSLQQVEEWAKHPHKPESRPADDLLNHMKPEDKQMLLQLRQLRKFKADLEKQNEAMKAQAQNFNDVLSSMVTQLNALQTRKADLEAQLEIANVATANLRASHQHQHDQHASNQPRGPQTIPRDLATIDPHTGQVLLDEYQLEMQAMLAAKHNDPAHKKGKQAMATQTSSTSTDSDDDADSLLDAPLDSLPPLPSQRDKPAPASSAQAPTTQQKQQHSVGVGTEFDNNDDDNSDDSDDDDDSDSSGSHHADNNYHMNWADPPVSGANRTTTTTTTTTQGTQAPPQGQRGISSMFDDLVTNAVGVRGVGVGGAGTFGDDDDDDEVV